MTKRWEFCNMWNILSNNGNKKWVVSMVSYASRTYKSYPYHWKFLLNFQNDLVLLILSKVTFQTLKFKGSANNQAPKNGTFLKIFICVALRAPLMLLLFVFFLLRFKGFIGPCPVIPFEKNLKFCKKCILYSVPFWVPLFLFSSILTFCVGDAPDYANCYV